MSDYPSITGPLVIPVRAVADAPVLAEGSAVVRARFGRLSFAGAALFGGLAGDVSELLPGHGATSSIGCTGSTIAGRRTDTVASVSPPNLRILAITPTPPQSRRP